MTPQRRQQIVRWRALRPYPGRLYTLEEIVEYEVLCDELGMSSGPIPRRENMDISYAILAQQWINDKLSNGATRRDMQDAARDLHNDQPELATAILDSIGHPVDDLYKDAMALLKIKDRMNESSGGTFMDLPAIVNCFIDECRHCGVEFVGWHVWRDPRQFIRPEISGRLVVKFCPVCGKEWQ